VTSGPAVRIGTTLPTFAPVAEPALLAARAAEAGGLDGVFAFDHLWPMGSPGRPALWSFGVLAAVAARTDRVVLGPLVARVGLLPDDDLVTSFATLAAIAGRERVIAAVGTGDRLSAAENLAYRLGFPPAAERLAAASALVERLRGRGLTTWIGGRSGATLGAARDHADALNIWGATVAEVRQASAELASGAVRPHGEVPGVTWGGQVLVGRDEAGLATLRERFGARAGVVAGTVPEVASHLRALADAGARWCVCAPLDYLADPVGAVETLCLVAGAVR